MPYYEGFRGQGLVQIKYITGYTIPMCPDVILLYLWEDPKIPAIRRDSFTSLPIAAKVLIMSKLETKESTTLQ